MAILVHGKRYLIMVLICISLVTTEVEQFLMCLLAIWISSLKKHHSNALPTWKLVYLFVHFKIVWLLTFKYSSHTVSTTNSLLHDLQIFFPHSVTYLFTFLIVSLDSLKFFNFLKILFIFFFGCSAFAIISKKILPNPRSQKFTFVFFSMSFLVLALKLRTLIYF